MNNRTQQHFDRSIQDALDTCADVNAAKPRRDVRTPKSTKRPRQPRGRMYLDPLTGATVWEPAIARHHK